MALYLFSCKEKLMFKCRGKVWYVLLELHEFHDVSLYLLLVAGWIQALTLGPSMGLTSLLPLT